MNLSKIAIALISVGILAGCQSKKTEKMGRDRPPVDELSGGGRGLQGKDVISASDQMAQDLLNSPLINNSKEQITIVVGNVKNKSVSQRFNMDIFLTRLKTNLAKYGQGRVTLIQNRDAYHENQSKELEQPAGDRFGQGGVNRTPPGPAGIQPDFMLDAEISELPNDGGTSYFLIQFSLGSLKTRIAPWVNSYEVTVQR